MEGTNTSSMHKISAKSEVVEMSNGGDKGIPNDHFSLGRNFRHHDRLQVAISSVFVTFLCENGESLLEI